MKLKLKVKMNKKSTDRNKIQSLYYLFISMHSIKDLAQSSHVHKYTSRVSASNCCSVWVQIFEFLEKVCP